MKRPALALMIPLILACAVRGSSAETAAPSAPAPKSVVNHERTVTDVAEGVYVIKHKDAPDTNPQGNTTVIIGDRDVLVIDSGYLPSSTNEDIAQIRQWTKKPVRWLVNTHWHPDHIRGNSLYADAFPGLAIVAHAVTPELEEGWDVPNRARYRARVTALEDQLKLGKGAEGKKLRDEDRKPMTEELAGRRAVLQEFASYVPAYPNATFSDAISIDLGGRTVQLKFYGRGHSSGDVVAYLPRERILVAGDLVTSPVPYFFAGYPYDEIATLESLAKLDTEAIVPGHGDVMLDESYLNRTIEVMKDIRDQVVRETHRLGPLSAKLEDVRKGVNYKTYAAEFAGTDKENLEFFTESMDGLVKTLYEQIPK
jgi:glyoxylase-like metal-dependent hydrolase (beta-lactamase superfamily II)